MADQPYWNPADKDSGNTLSNADRTSTQAASNSGGVRSTAYLSAGKWYVEIVVTNDNRYRTGVANSSYAVTANPGDTANSWTFRGGDGAKYHNAVADTSYWGTPTASGDVLMIAVDVDDHKIWWGVNGTWANSGDPATATNPAYTNLSASIALLFGSNASSGTKVNTLAEIASYAYSPPSGFTAGWGGSASAITGTASITEGGDSLSSTSTLRIQAAATVTEAGDSLSAVIGITPVLAVGAITEADDSVSSAGALLIQGSASITGDDDSLTGAGALFIIAASSAIDEDDSVASAAALLIQGGAAIGEGADLISSAGTLPIYGASGLAEADDSVIANDYVPRGRADLDEDDDLIRFHGGISAEWMQEQATKGDIPNWNHCARCHKGMRPNRMLQQSRRVGSSVVWTGLYVCSDCWDPIHPQDRQPRVMGGDPRPVPNARPFRGG